MSWTTAWRSWATACSVSLRGGRGRLERGNGQELVDRRRLRRLLREPVALGQRGDFVGADAFDQTVVLLPDSRLGSRAAGPFQENLEGSIEGGLCGVEMTRLELFPAVFEVLLRERNQIGDRIGLGNWRWSWWLAGQPLRQVLAGWPARARGPAHASREQRDEAHSPRQAATCTRHGVNVL